MPLEKTTQAARLRQVFWEVLLAVTVGAAKDEASLSAAARVWGFLRTSSKAGVELLSFGRFPFFVRQGHGCPCQAGLVGHHLKGSTLIEIGVIPRLPENLIVF